MKYWSGKMLAVVVGLVFTTLIFPACADEGEGGKKFEPRSFPVEPNVKSYRYYSKVMDKNYDISVGIPEDYDESLDKHYPILLVTDGNYMFPIVHRLVTGLASTKDIKPPLVISIGRPFEEGGEAGFRRRIYAFSPPDWPMTDPFGRRVAGHCERWQVALQECTGGAPKFLDFIVSELLSDLREIYRIDPEDVGLFGVSAGGFFASWAIFQENSLFNKYIISSPAMVYGAGEIFRQEKRYSDNHKDLAVEIYMSSGSLEMLETIDGFLEGTGRIVSGQARFGGVLKSRNYPGLTLYSEIHQGLGHVDVIPTTIARGLRLLYPRESKTIKQ